MLWVSRRLRLVRCNLGLAYLASGVSDWSIGVANRLMADIDRDMDRVRK